MSIISRIGKGTLIRGDDRVPVEFTISRNIFEDGSKGPEMGILFAPPGTRIGGFDAPVRLQFGTGEVLSVEIVGDPRQPSETVPFKFVEEGV